MIETKYNGRFWQAFDEESEYGFVGVGNTEQEAIDDLKKWLAAVDAKIKEAQNGNV